MTSVMTCTAMTRSSVLRNVGVVDGGDFEGEVMSAICVV